jgi:hypothetical protein
MQAKTFSIRNEFIFFGGARGEAPNPTSNFFVMVRSTITKKLPLSYLEM